MLNGLGKYQAVYQGVVNSPHLSKFAEQQLLNEQRWLSVGRYIHSMSRFVDPSDRNKYDTIFGVIRTCLLFYSPVLFKTNANYYVEYCVCSYLFTTHGNDKVLSNSWVCSYNFGRSQTGSSDGAVVVHLPSTNVARVRFPVSASHVG